MLLLRCVSHVKRSSKAWNNKVLLTPYLEEGAVASPVYLHSQWHRSDGSRMSSCVIVFWACACLCIVICEWKISGRFTLRITLDLFPLLCQGWRHLHTKLSLVCKRESGAACSDLRVLEAPPPCNHVTCIWIVPWLEYWLFFTTESFIYRLCVRQRVFALHNSFKKS